MATVGSVTHVNAKQFAEAIKGDKLVIVDFYATWCAPCKMIAPKLEILAKEKTSALFIKVDVDELGDIAADHKVTAMPTLIAFKKGTEVGRVVGSNEADIKKMVQKYI